MMKSHGSFFVGEWAVNRVSLGRIILLLVWAAGALGVPWFARELEGQILGWPFHLWWAAQGCVLFFVALCIAAVKLLGRWEHDEVE